MRIGNDKFIIGRLQYVTTRKKITALQQHNLDLGIRTWLNMSYWYLGKYEKGNEIYTSKYHVSCTDGKISLRINLFLLPIFPSSHSRDVFFFRVGLSSLTRHSQQILLGVEVSSVSWLGQFTKTCWECHVNDKRPTGKKNTTIEWDDCGKIDNKIN